MGTIVYLRIDPEGKPKKGLSLETQKLYIEHFFDKRWFITEFVEIATNDYINQGVRPILHKAVEHCLRNQHYLIIASLDSISKTDSEIFRLFRRLEGRLLSCDIPQLNEDSLKLFLKFRNRKSELISLHTKNGLSKKREKGLTIGNSANFTAEGRKKGSQANRKKSQTSLYKLELKEICLKYKNNNYSLRDIASILNTKGYRTTRDKEFKPNTVKRLLEM